MSHRPAPGGPTPPGVVLIGLMGAGKTQVGRQLAAELGWPFFDLDAQIEERVGCPIREIFAREGEAVFRRRELDTLRQLAREQRSSPVVLATGGGTPCQAAAWPLLRQLGRVIWLQVSPAQAAARLWAGREPVEQRPLLTASARPAGEEDLSQVLARLLGQRQAEYAQADFAVLTDGLSPVAVAAEVRRLLGLFAKGGAHGSVDPVATGRDQPTQPTEPTPVATPAGSDRRTVWVELGASRYPVYIGAGLLTQLGEWVRDPRVSAPSVHSVVVITNPTVRALYGERVQTSLVAAHLQGVWLEMPDGEVYKRLSTLERLYEEAAEQGVERGWPVVALGGGVVGDTAGLFAATFLRGLPLVQVPTTLLAQVDASVGGKVAVDLAAGKNLVGAFYQPRLVLIDPSALATLPPRQVRSGWAEVVKTAALAGGDLAALLDRLASAGASAPAAHLLARPGEGSLWADLLAACVAFKASVVAGDEREASGRRAILNLGHTVGHALERVTGYEGYTHGEAISIGMEMALRLSVAHAGLPTDSATRVRRWLAAAGLPVEPLNGRWPVAWPLLQAALRRDKKVTAGEIRWVLLRQLGEPVQMTLPFAAVEAALTAADETWAAGPEVTR